MPFSQFSHSFPSTMAQAPTFHASKRVAVVTGSNRGIGFEVCKQLASEGVTVVVTARDEKKGLEAVEKLKGIDGLSEFVVCHQLDVADSSSIASLADFVKTQFGKLDILVNNAGVGAIIVETKDGKPVHSDWRERMIETYELAEECLQINYYGSKGMAEAFLPLLELSASPRIVNVSSRRGSLSEIQNEWALGVLSDIESLTEEKLDQVLKEYLKDFKAGTLGTNGWPPRSSAYKVSKAALNAYTRLLAKKYPTMRINCVHPGYTKTDLTYNLGDFTATEGAENIGRLALLPDDGPSGQYFFVKEISPF